MSKRFLLALAFFAVAGSGARGAPISGTAPEMGGRPAGTPEQMAAIYRGAFSSPAYRKKKTTDAMFIRDVYVTVLGRLPEPPDKKHWLLALKSKKFTRGEVLEVVLKSKEFASLSRRPVPAPAPTPAPAPAPAGPPPPNKTADAYDVRAAFMATAYKKSHQTDAQFLSDLYAVALGRDPDPKGLRSWLAALQGGKVSRAQAVEGFLKSAEYADRSARLLPAGSAISPTKPASAALVAAYLDSPAYKKTNASDAAFLTDLYALALGRAPDAAGEKDWLAALASNKVSRAQVVAAFLKSPERAERVGSTPAPKPAPKPAPAPVTPVASPAPSSDKGRVSGNTVFNGAGLFVADVYACTVQHCGAANAAQLKAAGISWIAIQINNPGEVGSNTARLPAWADDWRQAGFKVGFWGVSYGHGAAATDGVLAAKLTAKYRGDFYIADCEGPFQQGEGDVTQNKAFVDAFSAEAASDGIGNIPRALSSMGRVALDMRPWIDGGWDVLPQAYWNDYQVYQPSLCVKFYLDWRGTPAEKGWPLARIHPTIGMYGATGDQPRVITLPDYAADLHAAGTTGFSYYLPESYLDAAQLQQLTELKGKFGKY